MTRHRAVVGALALAGALTIAQPTAPASAVDVNVGGITGSIEPQYGFGACASLTFSGGIVAGEFTAFATPVPTGVRSEDAPMDVPVVVDVVPFVATGSTWSHCFSGHVPTGVGFYSLVATGPGGDYAQVLQCRRLSGSLSCT